jgi:hypothetical protein
VTRSRRHLTILEQQSGAKFSWLRSDHANQNLCLIRREGSAQGATKLLYLGIYVELSGRLRRQRWVPKVHGRIIPNQKGGPHTTAPLRFNWIDAFRFLLLAVTGITGICRLIQIYCLQPHLKHAGQAAQKCFPFTIQDLLFSGIEFVLTCFLLSFNVAGFMTSLKVVRPARRFPPIRKCRSDMIIHVHSGYAERD